MREVESSTGICGSISASPCPATWTGIGWSISLPVS
jgi:hypothetical protein